MNLGEGVFELLKLVTAMAFLYVTSVIISAKRSNVLVITRSVMVTGLILAVIGVSQYYRVAFNEIPGNYEVYATMANKNLYASALFLTLPFVLYGAVRLSGSWKVVSLISLAAICFSLVLTSSRTVLAAVLLSTIVTTPLVAHFHKKLVHSDRKKSPHPWTRVGWLAVVVLVVIAGISFYTVHGVKNGVSEPDSKIAGFKDFSSGTKSFFSLASLKERTLLWKKTVQMSRANPWLGVGLGQWKIVFPSYGKIETWRESDSGPGEVWFQRPHNDYLWVLSETGVSGLVCYLTVFGVLIGYILKIMFGSKDMDRRIFSAFMLFGTTGYMVISFFSFPRERIVHPVLLTLLAGCVVSTYHQLFPTRQKIGGERMLLLNTPVLILLAFAMLVGAQRLTAECHMKRVLSARKAKDWQRVIVETDKADSPFYSMDPVSMPVAWYRGVANYSLGDMSNALKDFDKAYRIHPYNIHVLNNLASCYAILGDDHSAVRTYQEALALQPKFSHTLMNLSVVYFRMGRYGDAYDSLLLCGQGDKGGRIRAYRRIIENKLGSKV
jgi:O-antigen ligase